MGRRRRRRKESYESAQNDVVASTSQSSIKQPMGSCQQNGKRKYDASEAECLMDERHDEFSQPFVRRPFQGWGMK
jgi:hypothetical protein